MVYRRRYRSRRRRSFRPRRRRLARYIHRQISRRIEDKVSAVTLSTNFTAIGTSWINQDLCALISGNITGRRCTIKSIQVYGTYTGGQAGSVIDDWRDTIRIVIATWKNSGYPLNSNMSTVIQRDAAGEGEHLIRKYYDRYQVISANQVVQGAVAPFGVARNHVFKYYKRFKGGLRVYKDASGNFNKRLVFSARSDSNLVPHPGFEHGFIKIRYEDA